MPVVGQGAFQGNIRRAGSERIQFGQNGRQLGFWRELNQHFADSAVRNGIVNSTCLLGCAGKSK